MSDTKTLQSLLIQRDLHVDTTAIRLLNDGQLIRLWSANGDLIYYNETMKKITSYNPLDLCYYDLKTLWRFENDGYDKFKALMAQALLGKELSKDRSYRVRENMGQGYGAYHTVQMAVPVFSGENIAGVLVAGTSELIKKPA